MRYIVGISGASGAILAYRLIEELHKRDIEIYTVVTKNAYKVMEHELDNKFREAIKEYSTKVYRDDELTAPISSSSFMVDGMIIIPCSMNTIGKLAYGFIDNLLLRAADNQIKMRNILIIVPREAPLSSIHLRNLYRLSKHQNLYIIFPVLTYYHKPKTVKDMEDYIIGKILDLLGIEHSLYRRWGSEDK